MDFDGYEMNFYTKLFLGTGIPYGFIMGCFFGLRSGLIAGILLGMLSGLFFGFFMALVLGLFHKMQTKGISSGKGDHVGPNQSRTISLEIPIETAFGKCLQSLNTIKAKVTHKDESQGLIQATTGMSWKSIGEKINIQLSRNGNNKAEVTVSSSSKWVTTLVDYGKGYQNVTSIIDFINR